MPFDLTQALRIGHKTDSSNSFDERAARDAAVGSARLRGEFLANLSHGIRTPLNGIVGMTRLLLEKHLTNKQREMVDIARQSADAFLRIVSDVLDYSQIAAGKVALNSNDFNLNLAVESVIALFTEQAESRGIELVSYVDSDVPAALSGDWTRLCQVLSNLLSNAIKFTPYGEVSLRVGLAPSDNSEQLLLRFIVKDTGIGIPLDAQRYLFRAFAQGDGSTTRKFGGTGLGLAICAQLVELMGGSIGVQSQPRGGSTFWFTTAFTRATADSRAEAPDSSCLAGMRLLAFDRSSAAATALQQHARDLSIECEFVSNPAAAIVALKRAASQLRPFDAATYRIARARRGRVRDRAGDRVRHRTEQHHNYRDSRCRRATVRHSDPSARYPWPAPETGATIGTVLSTIVQKKNDPGIAASETLESKPRRLSDLRSQLPEAVRKRIRILLVEDNPVNQQVELRTMERIGVRADVVDTGREALEALELKNYDIVLMDCQMPEMDGYSATRAIRRQEKGNHRTIIIGVTGYALAGDREQCLPCGLDDYLAKPVAPEDLAATLEKWVGYLVEPSDRQPVEVVSKVA